MTTPAVVYTLESLAAYAVAHAARRDQRFGPAPRYSLGRRSFEPEWYLYKNGPMYRSGTLVFVTPEVGTAILGLRKPAGYALPPLTLVGLCERLGCTDIQQRVTAARAALAKQRARQARNATRRQVRDAAALLVTAVVQAAENGVPIVFARKHLLELIADLDAQMEPEETA